MFRTLPRFAVSPYGIFLKEAYKNEALTKKLTDLTFPQRAKLLSRVYKSLSKKEREAFYKTANQTPNWPRRQRKQAPLKQFATFVKNTIKTAEVQALPPGERFKRLAVLYRQ